MGDSREVLKKLRRKYALHAVNGPLTTQRGREEQLLFLRADEVSMEEALEKGMEPLLYATEGDDTIVVFEENLQRAREAAVRGGKPEKPVVVMY